MLPSNKEIADITPNTNSGKLTLSTPNMFGNISVANHHNG